MDRSHIRSLKQCFRITAVFVAVVICFGSWSCSRSDYSGMMETIHVGVPPLEQNALLYIAEHKGFFANNGLRAAIKGYDTGVTALEGLLNGEVNITGAAEFPVVRAAFRREEIQKRLGYEDSYVARIGPQHRFSLSLNQTLVVAMKDEAQWLIDSRLTNERTIPDFVSYMYTDALKAVKPDSVNIIGR